MSSIKKMMVKCAWIGLALGAFIGAGMATAAEPAAKANDKEFLVKAAGGQKAEIALGEMATQRAESDKVKQFGQRMIEDHQKAGKEISQLAFKEGIELPADMPDMHKKSAERFSQLSGKEFDRAYIAYMLQDHMKDVTEFERGVNNIKDQQVKQWASSALPVLKEHLKLAKTIAGDLGIDSKASH